MCKIERKVKDDVITLSTRISKGFNEDGSRNRLRYSLKLDMKKYPTEEQQNKAFKDYLIEQGVNENQFEEKDNENYQETENKISSQKNDLVFIEDIKTNEVTTRTIVKLRLDQLEVYELNPSNPPEEFIERLAKSIYEDGLNNPIRVVKFKNKYLIQQGNKRYKAFQLLNKRYGNDYEEIECYILDYELDQDKEKIDPTFALKLMRDNINTYERTLKDKILEVELYHKIFPELKVQGIASGRENEWIAKEMGVADKSVKDYLKLIKVPNIKERYFKEEIELLETALQLVDFYKEYGGKEYLKLINESRKEYCKYNQNADFKVFPYMINNYVWKKEREERERKQKELDKQRELEKPNQKEDDTDVQEEKQKYQVPIFENYDNLPHYYFETSSLEEMEISLEIDNLNIEFIFLNEFDHQKYYFDIHLYSSNDCLEMNLIRKPEDAKESYWIYNCPSENKLFKVRMNVEEIEVDIFRCMKNIDDVLNKEKIILTIDDKENFIAKLLDNVLIDKKKVG